MQRSKKQGKGGRNRSHGGGRPKRPGKVERQVLREERSAPKPAMSGILGELRLHRDGYGFVVPADGTPDLFIPARFVGNALHTDFVEARQVAEQGGKREGRIVRVVEHRVTRLMGRLERMGRVMQVVADDRRVHHRIIVPQEKLGQGRDGQNVVVRVLCYAEGDQPMQGEVIQVLGNRGEEPTEREAVIARHQLRRDFPPAAAREARDSRRLLASADEAGRRDLRAIPFVTIDGETAKDFDDAVAVQRLAGGIIRLWVSIADVSFFVRQGTALDAAAFQRGTSVYFPGDCLPMLPEELSNNLCSLRPREERLTFTAELDVDPAGAVVRRDFYRSVICSRERLTYTQVRQVLVDRDPAVIQQLGDLVTELRLMEELFGWLRKQRVARGSIDFDLPEPEIVLDLQGEVSEIVRSERHVGHMLIEEFMIAANEAVAEFLTAARAGCIYRVHEPPPPEKLRDFRLLLNNLGLRIRIAERPPPGSLAQVVAAVHGRPEERLVNHMLLRSMAQAVYSSENLGHYGLASRCYCHFTSPIRRYPDLVVHRLLAQALASGADPAQLRLPEQGTPGRGEGRATRPARLQEVSEHCSRRDRIAMEAEREMAKLYAALFMQDHLEKEFEGIVSHVAKFGFYVELIDYFIEGMVHVSALDDDHYIYEESGMMLRGRKRKKTYKVGDRVRIMVEEVDVPNREILFALVD